MKLFGPDVYTRVTNRIVAQLEQGVKPWTRPWDAAGTGGKILMPLRANGEAYRGINTMLLWGAIEENGYTEPVFMTFKQAQAEHAHVRKGEKGHLVVFASHIDREEVNDKGETEEVHIPFMKAYNVFNVAQIDDLPEKYRAKPSPVSTRHLDLLENCEAFFAATNAEFRHGGSHAFYRPATDHIQLPEPDAFHSAEAYAATKAHELVHWTSHKDRCDRQLGKRFGDDAYAAEELIAEIGSAFLCADLGLKPTHIDDHASYIDHWLKVLKSDRRAIFTAASQAQKSATFLHDLTGPRLLQDIRPDPVPQHTAWEQLPLLSGLEGPALSAAWTGAGKVVKVKDPLPAPGPKGLQL